ncbi:MAG: hypothetical protein DHS20C01_37390 [marine bacterium B5-7]|nr:MAG: hypothetical protein DHS20C01_37390 [marine bacterium B5-7]
MAYTPSVNHAREMPDSPRLLTVPLADERFHFVNNNDIVTRVPAWIRGYRQGGAMVYFDTAGQLLDTISLLRKLIDGIGEMAPDALNDQSREKRIPG